MPKMTIASSTLSFNSIPFHLNDLAIDINLILSKWLKTKAEVTAFILSIHSDSNFHPFISTDRWRGPHYLHSKITPSEIQLEFVFVYFAPFSSWNRLRVGFGAENAMYIVRKALRKLIY